MPGNTVDNMGVPVKFIPAYVKYHLGIELRREPSFRPTLRQLLDSSRYVADSELRRLRYRTQRRR